MNEDDREAHKICFRIDEAIWEIRCAVERADGLPARCVAEIHCELRKSIATLGQIVDQLGTAPEAKS